MTAPKLSVSQPSTFNPQPVCRRRAKVARLPKTTRDQINQRILNGMPYRDIIAQLGLQLWDITEDNLHTWKQGGYQDWLHAQQCLAQLRAQATLATELLRQQDNATLHQASLHLAITQLTAAFRNSGPSLSAQDPQTYLRLVTVLCRLSQQSLRYERYRQTRAQPPQPAPTPAAPSDHQHHALAEKLRRLLGLE